MVVSVCCDGTQTKMYVDEDGVALLISNLFTEALRQGEKSVKGTCGAAFVLVPGTYQWTQTLSQLTGTYQAASLSSEANCSLVSSDVD